MSPSKRNTVVLAVILAMIAAVVPAARDRIDRIPSLLSDPSSGAVEVPDHPEGTEFNPNQLKDIKAGDPASAVNVINPPSPNNRGDARVSYPIEVPPGRAGIQPKLAVTYSSGAGDSWAGVGWDLPMQAITIDTRWGVPRYETGTETETYLLNGEQLTPVAHRGDVPRSAEKVFHTRVEGKFAKIVRHGDRPANYWWEVTDKNGMRSFFGGTPATGAAVDSTLTDADGNIATWSLREMRDLNDNFMRYHCVRVADPGVAGGAVPGSNLYLQRITYTGHGDTEGAYSVTFTRDRDLSEPRRPDVMIDARLGFKKVTADLLRKVEVSLGNQLIRRYELDYRTGAFDKTLLRSISQFGADGNVFNTHELEYFDDVRDAGGAYQAFGNATGWTVPGDGLGASVPDGNASALQANTSQGVGGHLYVGFNPALPRKPGSAGVKVGFNSGSSEGLLALADVNGDSLPDKVFRTGSGIFYRPNLSGPHGQPRFGDTPIRLNNLPGISSENTNSSTVGVEAYFGVSAQLDFVSTTTTTDRYFLDVNGDGITDLVSNGSVLFGFLDANGNPSYSANSGDSGVPVGAGAASGTIVGDQTAEFERQVDAAPLLDSVRRWVAPYDGTVRVAGGVRLVQDPAQAAYRRADGVRVTIQHEGSELWAQRIGPDDFGTFTPSGVDSVQVHRGDRLYFRVQSILDGSFDQVSWDPDVTYTNLAPGTDVNGLDNRRFLASRDFTLGGRQSIVTAPVTGTLHLAGDVSKTGSTTDDVTVVITRNGTEVLNRTLAGGSGGTVPVDLDIPVTADDTLSWKLKADSPIDLGTLHWVPEAFYTAADGGVPVADQDGNPTLRINPPYEVDMYPATTLTAPQGFSTAPASGNVTVEPNLAFNFGGQTPNARVVFTVKRRGQLLAKRAIDIVNGQVPAIGALTVPVTAGDDLFFDFSTVDTTLLGRLTSQSVTVDGTTVPSAFNAAADQAAFPQPYRGWGAIGYQGNRDRATTPIQQSDLVIDQNFRDQLPGAPVEGDVPGFQGRVNTPKFVVFAPQPAQDRWGSSDENTWVAAASASSSRLGVDTIDVAQDADFAGATGISRVGRTQQISTTFGAQIPGIPIGVGASGAFGDSKGQVDFLDLNGDRFPDVVGSGGIQYSDMVGGLGGKRGSLGEDSVRKGDTTAFTVSANAGSPARSMSNGRGMAAPPADVSANTAKSGTEMPGLGVGGSLGGGDSNAKFDLLDINGDNLPDKIFDNGTAALNLGYRFAAPEPWQGAGAVNDGDTRNTAVNLGFNTDFYGFAGGLSAALGSSKTEQSLMDMNGDGLLDRVFSSGGSPFAVAINAGSRFLAPAPFGGGASGINADANSTLGGGVYFTFGFCLGILAGGCIVFNPGADFSTGIGRAEVALRDVNGDGYTDQVRSTRDNELLVSENRTGRTNLLRSVARPLGARFDLEYTRDGNTKDDPESRFVLSKATVFDGHAGDGQDTQLLTYRYENGRYDRLEREFYGYGRVVAEQRDPGAGGAVYRTTASDYRTDSYYTHNLVSRSLTADGAGRPFLERLSTYTLRDVGTGGSADPRSTTATVFPQLSRADRRFYEGQPVAGKSTFMELSYDELGNVTRAFDAADAGTTDDVETRTRYTSTDPACRARNIVVPNFVQVVATATGTELRHRESTIDCTNGNVRQVRAFLADGSAAVTDLDYFDNGNLKTAIDPPNKDNQRYRLDYGYDTVVGVHIESIVDSFGYRSSATHDLRFGLPATMIDENNQQLRTSYDAVGRIDSITGPYELPENRVTIDFEYHPEAAVPYAVTRHVDRSAAGVRGDTIDTIQFIDGLKRPLQTKKDASVSPSAGADPQSVMTVSGRMTFDFIGRKVEQFYPVTEPKGAGNTTFNPAFDTVVPTRVSYDILDRPVRTVIPDNTAITTGYGFGPDRSGATQFETVTTDANGKQRRTYTDVRELGTSVKEFNPAGGQPVIWTSYGYDAIGQITSVVDDRNNTTRSAYDNFGRRTIVDSPDSGRTETRYDLSGNVTQKITAKLRASNQAVEYDYQFDRIAAIRYPVFPGNNVTYTYGAPGAPDNAADRITEIHDAAGTVTRAYGPLGETTRETRVVTAINGPARTYTTQYRFDAFNRVLQLTYPDTEVLTYEYDSGGQVNRATGHKGAFDYTYLARMDYDKFEQRVLLDVGNGVRTTYSYDAADRRLATLRSQLPDGFNFQNISYTYDNVGNVLQLHNDVPVPHGKPIGGPSTQTFGYDDLYRLTSASGEYHNKDNKLDRYSLTLAYDTINNVTAKSQRHEVEVNPSSSSSQALSFGTVGTKSVSTVLEDPVPTEPVPTDPALAPLGPIEEPEDTVTDPGTGSLSLASASLASAGTSSVQEQRRTTYDYNYAYGSGKPHAPSVIGPVNHGYDANGNLVDAENTLPPAPGKRRQLVWDEENRLACNQDHNRNSTLPQDPSACGTPQQPATVRYVYDDQGNRIVKDAGPQHIYPNRNFSERNGTGFKHIFVGETRLLTKTVKPDSTFENHHFYFHADHLGSSSYVTDENSNLTEHLEYFAFGETWVDENPAQPTPVPYQFGAKELDEETGLYYYGARYYNPRTQLWQSPDPALESYLDGKPNGGVGQPFNLALYTYASDNPVRLSDPDGRSVWDYVTWTRVKGGLQVAGGASISALGAGIGVGASWTGVGAVAGGALFLWGADIAGAGVRQVISDRQESTLVAQGVSRVTGVDQETVDHYEAMAQMGVSVAGLARQSPTLLGAAANTTRAGGSVSYGALDALGRPTGVSAVITGRMINTGTRVPQTLNPPGYVNFQIFRHVRGHLLARLLGGSGSEARNVVTLFEQANSPVMRGFEAQVAAAVRGGQTVTYSVTPIYEGANLIPRGITITAKGSGNLDLAVTILNRQ
ncbi:MAG TPA: SpvB/TcaC N-terminal domain-containing protein [Actinophytocola sp.]|uniref:DNA/RNA non-specific endonuclease n=1 Tax=Actinophytocola sp. TaxID=1872138 RepID=UPI002DF7FF8D|nr:SpvB/TcaC N-terminal domain-containing protein [Actinophytocola sp.]